MYQLIIGIHEVYIICASEHKYKYMYIERDDVKTVAQDCPGWLLGLIDEEDDDDDDEAL